MCDDYPSTIYLFDCSKPIPEDFSYTLSDVNIKNTIMRLLDEGSPEDYKAFAKALWGGDWEFISKEDYFCDYGANDLEEYKACWGEDEKFFFDWSPNPKEGSFHWDLTRK